MLHVDDILFSSQAIDPDADLDAQLATLPGRWVVYFLCDADDAPIQLLCVKNLRASLKRRLGENLIIGPTKKVNYRQIVRKVRYRRVDSAFEADWVYLQAAKRVFAQTYRGMIGFRPAWFVSIDPDAPFPRFQKLQLEAGARRRNESATKGMLLGPIDDKHAAQRFIELIEDSFDLCRYYSILAQSPNGKPCAYKQMHKCPAPCDGTISMDQYRLTIEWAIQTALNPSDEIAAQKSRMQMAAGDLNFEAAGKIKQFVDQLSQFATGSFRHVATLSDFRFVTFQKGPRANSAKVFVARPAGIEHVMSLRDLDDADAALCDHLAGRLDEPGVAIDPDEMAVVCRHLFSPKASATIFFRARDLSEKSIQKALRDLRKQPDEAENPPGSDDEGIVQEMTSM